MVTARFIRRVRRALLVLEAMIYLALPASIVQVWRTWPGESAPVTAATAVPVEAERVASAQTLEWYSPLWRRDWKQPPIPPAVPSPSIAPVESGPIPVLLATLIEPRGRYAQLIGRNGKSQMRALEEPIDQFTVRGIEPGRVQLTDGARTLWVEIPKVKDKPK